MNFQVKAVKGKEMVVLNVSAVHDADAISQVKVRGYTPISVTFNENGLSKKRVKAFSISLFSQELLALLDAGLNLVESIETLAVKDEQRGSSPTLDLILQSLYQGQTFSMALEQQQDIFPVLYIATVKASEKTGDLQESLRRYVAYQEQLEKLKKKIVSASIYPMLLMIVGGLVILFLLGFVVPKFSRIYEGAGDDLPYLSQLLLLWGNLLAEHGKAILFGLVAFVIAISVALSQSKVRAYCLSLLWRLPVLGKQLHRYQLARFYRTVGMLLKGGTPIIPALISAIGLLDSTLQQSMKKAELFITEGKPISESMSKAGLTTPVALRMLMVGERGGNIGDMMERVANFYDEELSRWIDWFTRLFEPILMLIIGLVIGVVVLLLYMPIFELAGNIQ